MHVVAARHACCTRWQGQGRTDHHPFVAELAAVASSPSVPSPRPNELGGSTAGSDAAGRESAALLGERLVSELVEAGAVPPLLRLRGLGYPRCACVAYYTVFAAACCTAPLARSLLVPSASFVAVRSTVYMALNAGQHAAVCRHSLPCSTWLLWILLACCSALRRLAKAFQHTTVSESLQLQFHSTM